MKKCNVAVLGATGAVGCEMVKALVERNFPINNLKLLSGKRSAGMKISVGDKEYIVEKANDDSFENMDIVLSSVESDVTRRFAPVIKASGAVMIDNSNTFRLDDDVPLVVPEINPQDIKKHNGIIANPNCTTVISMMAIYSISKLAPVKSIIASTYQAVSGAGIDGLHELETQCGEYAKSEPIVCDVFKKQILHNLIPKISEVTSNGYTGEEMKLQNEGRKIMHLPELKATCTCVRVPVMRSHSVSMTITTEREISVDEAREAIKNANGCVLIDDAQNEEYPTPLATSDQDLVYVGRIRKDLVLDNSLALWCCGDQLRKGAAVNAVQIAECLVNN